MASSAERDEIKSLRGMTTSQYRDASTPQLVWKRNPTLIPTPKNSPLFHPSGTNPMSSVQHGNLKGKARQRGNNTNAGNPTSQRTLLGRHDGPPSKKQKITHGSGFGGFQMTENSDRPRPRLAPEPIVIDDDSEVIPESPRRRHENVQRQSSDELNIHGAGDHHSSREISKYPFPVVQRSTRDPPVAGIVPDGKNSMWIDDNFGDDSRPVVEDSDPIEDDFEDVPYSVGQHRRDTRGHVKRQVAKIDAQASIVGTLVLPKVNLAQKIRLPGKDKLKPKLKNHVVFKPQTPVAASSKVAHELNILDSKFTISDSIATSPTLNKAAEKGPLSVEEVYFDRHHIADTQEYPLELYWSSESVIILKRGKTTHFRLPLVAKSNYQTKYIEPNTPKHIFKIVQFESLASSEEISMITIKFRSKDAYWKSAHYNQFIIFLKSVYTETMGIRNAEVFWEQARRHADNMPATKSEPSSRPTRMQELCEIQSRRSGLGSASKVSTSTPNPLESQIATDIQEEDRPSRSVSTARSDLAQENAGPSTRRRSARNAPPEKMARATDQDEVILVYPPGVPGGVNVTNGDLARLESTEYLNDTIIEFGLKLWLARLEKEDPDLAKQIHVFNSFFYKKLNSKKDVKNTYESVRKWTSKFDIFQKKYIIVPINEHLHWYLAIIYEPEHILSSTEPESLSPSKNTRSAAKNVAPLETSVIPDEPKAEEENISHQTSSEAEVERNLNDGFQNSCNIDEVADIQLEGIADDDSSVLSYVTDPMDRTALTESRAVSPSASDFGDPRFTGKFRRVSPASNDMMVDDPEEVQLQDDGNITRSAPNRTSISAPVDAASFYQRSTKAKGKRKADLDLVQKDVDQDENNGDEVIIINETPQTRIFTLDSLGSNHPAAVKRLGQYLQKEAEDKKGIKNAVLAKGKQMPVPLQPNFWDCGLYLLHLAETFVADPKRYYGLYMTTKRPPQQDLKALWKVDVVDGLREVLANRIRELSDDWKRIQATKPIQVDDKDDSSDSDIKVLSQPKKQRQSNQAARLRG